ncbi:MAG: hypothetical protein RLZZ76_527 [Candidatus Parcubacteria bacterium]|jgi:hypothetical protein
MIVALTYVGVSIGALLLLTFVYVVEDIKGDRVFFLSLRDKLDAFFMRVLRKIELFMFSLSTGFVRILLHYGAHSILKRTLAFIKTLEVRVEELVRKNRRIAKSISAIRSKSHLGSLADHKDEVALTEKEKTDLMSH